jgi:hypothetical protein
LELPDPPDLIKCGALKMKSIGKDSNVKIGS